MSRAFPTALLTLVVASAAFAGELLDKPIAAVERLRDLAFLRPVAQKTIPRDQLRKYLVAQLQKELPIPIEDYLRVLDALELIERDEKTLDEILALYESQVLAFYDPLDDVYYSLADAPKGIELGEMLTDALVIHELTHALQDQRFNAGDRLIAMRGNSDAQMAYQALLEGEAMLVMAASLFEQLGQDLNAIVQNDLFLASMSVVAQLNPGIPSSVPRYFVESLKFPYLEGLRFVVVAYRRGGWPAVDALHDSPPSSTEQILHPDKFFENRTETAPAIVRPAGRKVLLKETMGEFSWRFLLGEKAASGWGGDWVQMTQRVGGSLNISIESSWDSEADAAEFAQAYGEFLKSRSITPQIRTQNRRVSVSYRAH